jgi:hypothetical protein
MSELPAAAFDISVKGDGVPGTQPVDGGPGPGRLGRGHEAESGLVLQPAGGAQGRGQPGVHAGPAVAQPRLGVQVVNGHEPAPDAVAGQPVVAARPDRRVAQLGRAQVPALFEGEPQLILADAVGLVPHNRSR